MNNKPLIGAALIGQSGGPSAVINASTYGVIKTAMESEYIIGWTGWISLQSKGLSRVFSKTTVQKHQFFSAQLSSQWNITHP